MSGKPGLFRPIVKQAAAEEGGDTIVVVNDTISPIFTDNLKTSSLAGDPTNANSNFSHIDAVQALHEIADNEYDHENVFDGIGVDRWA